MWLTDFVEDYLQRTDVGEAYAEQLRWCVRGFSKFLERPACLDHLNSRDINAYLAHLRKAGYAGETRRSRRRILLTLSSDAARQRLIDPVNRDMVARIKVFPAVPDGLTWSEARNIIIAINAKGKYDHWFCYRYRKTGIVRRDWWRAYLSACWDTGAPADLRSLRWEELQENGRVYRLRGKTGKPLRWQLSSYTMDAIARLANPPYRPLVFPLWGCLDRFRREARKIIQEVAGLKGKSLGGFRSGAGTDAELRHGTGAGCQLLGNTPQVFVKHYEIAPLIERPAMSPRPLMDDLEAQECQTTEETEQTANWSATCARRTLS